jgi:hypothetical protein
MTFIILDTIVRMIIIVLKYYCLDSFKIIMDNQLILIILVCVVFAIYVWLKEFLIKKAEQEFLI